MTRTILTLRQVKTITQHVGGDVREVDLTYDTATARIPNSMTVNGRTWTFVNADGFTLNQIRYFAGGSWGSTIRTG